MTTYPQRSLDEIIKAVSGLQDSGVRLRIALDMAAAQEAIEAEKQKAKGLPYMKT
jgi:hypothetical protein